MTVVDQLPDEPAISAGFCFVETKKTRGRPRKIKPPVALSPSRFYFQYELEKYAAELSAYNLTKEINDTKK